MGDGPGNLREASKEELARRVRNLRRQVRRLKEGVDPEGVNPNNLVWVFGSGRTGSTWLARMLGEHTRAGAEASAGERRNGFWNEPWAGAVFQAALGKAEEAERRGRGFVLSPHYRAVWLGSLRHLVLSGANARFGSYGKEDTLVVKEPGGSFAAPLLMEALPESRMVFLVRDPRDVVASQLDAHREGAWMASERTEQETLEHVLARYSRNIDAAREAHEMHGGPKSFARYEDIRADPEGELLRIHLELTLPIEEERIAFAVKKHAWEAIPAQKKGAGKKFRKASPGSWQEDLTPEQARMVEKATRPVIEELYS